MGIVENWSRIELAFVVDLAVICDSPHAHPNESSHRLDFGPKGRKCVAVPGKSGASPSRDLGRDLGKGKRLNAGSPVPRAGSVVAEYPKNVK